MECARVTFTGHAVSRMFERRLSKEDVVAVIRRGDVIQTYPDDRPYPSSLLLGFVRNQPVHVLVAQDDSTGECYVVTAYIPDPAIWLPGFKRKKG